MLELELFEVVGTRNFVRRILFLFVRGSAAVPNSLRSGIRWQCFRIYGSDRYRILLRTRMPLPFRRVVGAITPFHIVRTGIQCFFVHLQLRFPVFFW